MSVVPAFKITATLLITRSDGSDIGLKEEEKPIANELGNSVHKAGDEAQRS